MTEKQTVSLQKPDGVFLHGKYTTILQFCRASGISRRVVARWLSEGLLNTVAVGETGLHLIPETEVNRIYNRLRPRGNSFILKRTPQERRIIKKLKETSS